MFVGEIGLLYFFTVTDSILFIFKLLLSKVRICIYFLDFLCLSQVDFYSDIIKLNPKLKINIKIVFYII